MDLEDRLSGLMARYQSGDAAAFEEIYSLTVGAVRTCLSGTAGRGGASLGDLVQETYLQVHRARRSYRPATPLRPWLFAIARHVALQAERTHRRKWARHVIQELSGIEGPSESPDVIGKRHLTEAMAKLPPAQRQVVWLARVEGMTSAEISRMIGVSAGAVKVRLHRAERKLISWLGGSGDHGD